MKRIAIVVSLAGMVSAAPIRAQGIDLPIPAPDDPGGFWSILPPGQEGNVNVLQGAAFFTQGETPEHYQDQREMYDRLPREFGTLTMQTIEDGPSTWKVAKSKEEIRFSPVGVINLEPIDWQNRPTFQQAVQVERARQP